MPLTLLAGPAHAGKVALLLERYLAVLPREPVLIVPNAPDVERVERDLLRRCGALLGGSIVTFDDLFRRIAAGSPAYRPPLGEIQRSLAVRRAIERVSLDGLAPSARFGGFADALAAALAELENGLVEPEEAPGELAALHAAYRGALDGIGRWDLPMLRRHAAERVAGDLAAWQGQPVFAYGFEDLTAAEWALLEALAGRTEVTVSLPYEPGRVAFASLERTAADLQLLAGPGRSEELPPRYGEWSPPALAYLERHLFEAVPGAAAAAAAAAPPPLDGAIRFLEGAGARATLELVGQELLALIRAGTSPERIAIVCPGIDRWRAPLETALGSLGVPVAVEGRVPLRQTAFGQALLAAVRFAWGAEPTRGDLYAFLRSPYSGLQRAHVDYVEGRLRGRAVRRPELVEEETRKHRGAELPLIPALRAATDPVGALREAGRALLRAAHGLDAPPATEAAQADLRAHEALVEALAELDDWCALGGDGPGGDGPGGAHLSREDVVAAIERATVTLARPLEAGRVHVLDLLRARTRSSTYDVVAVIGLEEGSLPRRESVTPFLDDDVRRVLDERRRSARLVRPDGVERDRYLFYTACTRPERQLLLVREAASDEGGERQPSPFWEEVRRLFPAAAVAAATVRRPLAALTWPAAEAPTEREQLRALAALLPVAPAAAFAAARAVDGWERRLERARDAFDRPTRLTDPAVLAELGARTSFRATELEYYADCPSIWFFNRVIDPKSIDAEPDALLRGILAHTTLHRFFAGLPRNVGVDKPDEASLDACLAFLRECLDGALAGGVRLDLTELERRELEHTLHRDLGEYIRKEAAGERQLVPRRFEVGFGTDRSAPELQRGLELGEGLFVSGKIDRIDVDPWSARGIVVDYKSGKTVHSAKEIERDLRLQVPLYMLVLRDLVGIEPLGGVYQALAGERAARGMLRAESADDGVGGFVKTDYLDEETFWAQVEGARELALTIARAIRSGAVEHRPRWGECPAYCDKAPMCRVTR